MPEIRESFEVVDQRVRDLAVYFQGCFPQMFTGTDSSIPKAKLIHVLEELDEEFSYSEMHRIQVCAVMAGRITNKIEPLLDSVAVNHMEALNFSVEELDEIAEGVSGPMEVFWSDLYPYIQEGDLGLGFKIAGVNVSSMLNASLWEEPSWDTSSDTLLEAMPDAFELYFGIVALLLLAAYVQVVILDIYPQIKYNPNI